MKQLMMTMLVLLTLVSGFSGHALANGMDNAARDHLGAMVNNTDPSIYMSSRGATVGLGSFSVRVDRQRGANLFSMTPPMISQGCGGWDIFAGSFSILSADRIMQTLRSMASAIPMVAFRMALAWLSQQLEDKVSDVFKQLMEFNEAFQSSCEIQNTLMKGFDEKADNLFAEMGQTLRDNSSQVLDRWKTVFSRTNDMAETREDPNRAQRGAAEAYADGDQGLIERNWMFDALKGVNVLAGGNGETPPDLLFDLMSFTGIVQTCVMSQGDGKRCLSPTEVDALDGDEKEMTSIQKSTIQSLMSFEELLIGHQTADGRKAMNSRVVQCHPDTPANHTIPCQLMVTVERSTPLVGMEKIIKDAFLGPTNSTGQGILGRASTAGTAPTAYELGILSASGAFGRAIMDARKISGEAHARLLVDRHAKAIANEVGYNLLSGMLTQLRAKMVTMGESEGLRDSLVILEGAIRRATREHNEIAKKEAAGKALEEIQHMIASDRPIVSS